MPRYELLKDETVKSWDGRTLFRIRRLKDGKKGGYIESERNLDQGDDSSAWVSGEAQVYDEAQVYGEARVYGKAWVSGEARVSGENWLSIGPIGSRMAYLSIWKNADDSLGAATGCWLGSLDELEKRVVEVHGGSNHAKRYLAATRFAREVLGGKKVNA